jgi:replicative DNA helicase Mcm
MAQTAEGELVDRFEAFYRNYYRDEIARLAQNYPSEQRSLEVDWSDLYQFDADIADDYISKPEQLREYAEEALRLYDLPVDVSLGQAHVRIRNLPDVTDIREIRSPDVNTLIAVSGIIRKATDVRPKIQEAAFECQRCGTLSYIPQSGGFQEPHECQGCERQGPFSVNYDQSTFVDAQKIRVQERPEGLRGGETPQSIDVDLEDDITGDVAPGDYVTMTGVLRIDQQEDQSGKSRMFDVFMDGHSLVLEDEEFEEMDISEADKRAIVELSQETDIYDRVIESIAPSIYGYDEEKLAIAMQLFSGVTKNLPDDSRIRGDLHILLIGDPGTGKCIAGDTEVTLADEARKPIREIVESNLDDPKPVDDGVYDEVDFTVPSLGDDGSITHRRARKVWKREAPDRTYRIRTAGGREIEVTPSHPLFVHSGDSLDPRRAEKLREGDVIAVNSCRKNVDTGSRDGRSGVAVTRPPVERQVGREPIASIETVDPDYEWVYDLEVEGTHSYLSNGIVSHNSQLLQYVQHIAPRSVYTSGKGSSAAGLTAAAVQSDFGEGQAWTLEAGALVLADKGVAAIDELDKMKCVTGDSLVRTGSGVVRIERLATAAARDGTIEELPTGRTIRDIDATARTMTADGRIVERPVTAVHEYDAPDRLVEVRLVSGESVTATPDHPFYIRENGERLERRAAKLTAGDAVPVPRSDPIATDGAGKSVTEAGETSPGKVRREVEWTDVAAVTSTEGSARRVYDLTVEGTHNFVANGMVVHNSEDRSAMHEGLEQQEISISKAGITATLKSRCSLLGAANPKYGRFDEYEPIAEQIELDPALISRFDLIFTVTDQPDEEEDRRLAEHIIQSNYAGELSTQHEKLASPNVTMEAATEAARNVEPTIDAELLQKYVAYAKRDVFPTMTEEARERIREFYVEMRSQGTGEDAPVPITARKLEALVRLGEASARVRLSDTVEEEDAERVIDIVQSSLRDVGMDPETGEFDADIIETEMSKSQRDRVKNLKTLIEEIEEEYEEGAPAEEVIERAEEIGMAESKAEHEVDKLKQKGELYEPMQGYLRTT